MRIDELTESKNFFPEIVKEIVATIPSTQEIWFHGSRAIGKHKPSSDWDILVVVDESIRGDKYLVVVRQLQKISMEYKNFDIQSSHPNHNITQIAREEGQLLWKRQN